VEASSPAGHTFPGQRKQPAGDTLEEPRSKYKCRNCGRLVTLKEGEPVRCNYCGYRILYKVRPDQPKRIKAR